MKQFLALLKLSLRCALLTTSGLSRQGRKRAATGLGALLLIAALGLYISGVYSYLLMTALAPAGMEELLFVLMGAIALLGGLLFTTLAVRGVVFGGKDNDLLLALPVPSAMLVAARVTAIYLESLLFSAFVLVPAGVACALLSERGLGRDVLFWVRLTVAALALPLLDTAIAVLLGAAMAFVSVKVSRGRVLGQNIAMGIFLVGVFWFSFRLSGALSTLSDSVGGMRRWLSWAVPLMWMGEGVSGNWGLLLAFVACCALPFAAMTFILGRTFRQVTTALSARTARNDYKLTAQRPAGQGAALLAREARRFFGTPVYFWNAGLGPLLLVVMSGAALIYRGRLAGLLGALDGALPIMPLTGAAIGFCLCSCAVAAPSISLEGKCLWILREAPVEEKTVLWCKAGFQMLLTLPCAGLACLCLSFALALPLGEGALLLADMLLLAVGHACFSVLLGLAFPRLDAPNETVVIKQSLAVMLSELGGMVLLGLAGLLWWLGGLASAWLALALPTVLLAAFGVLCAVLLAWRGPAMLRRL